MSIKKLQIDPQDLLKMNRKELARLSYSLVNQTKKLLKKWHNSKRPLPPSVQRFDKIDFGVRGKNLNDLRHQFSQMKSFLEGKTTTPAKWDKYNEKQRQSLNERLDELSGERDPDYTLNEKQEKRFWKLYEKLQTSEQSHLINDYGSTQVQAQLRKEVAKGTKFDLRRKNVFDKLSNSIEQEYERMQMQNKKDLDEYERMLNDSFDTDFEDFDL